MKFLQSEAFIERIVDFLL